LLRPLVQPPAVISQAYVPAIDVVGTQKPPVSTPQACEVSIMSTQATPVVDISASQLPVASTEGISASTDCIEASDVSSLLEQFEEGRLAGVCYKFVQ